MVCVLTEFQNFRTSEKRKYVGTEAKVEALLKVLCEKGPLSLSSLAEEVAKMLNMKVSTVRSAIVKIVNDLISLGVLKEVGTDRFGSRLIDFTPKGFFVLQRLRNFPREYVFKLVKRKVPELIDYVEFTFIVWDANEIIEEAIAEWLGIKLEIPKESILNKIKVIAHSANYEPHLPDDWYAEPLKDFMLSKIAEIIEDRIATLPYGYPNKNEAEEFFQYIIEQAKKKQLINVLKETLNKVEDDIYNEIKGLELILKFLNNVKKSI